MYFNNNLFTGDSDSAIVTLSGFAAPVESHTIRNIYNFADEHSLDVYTFNKPGHFGSKETFSIEKMASDIKNLINEIINSYESVMLIANSMTTPAFLHAYSQLKRKTKKKISEILFLSPVFDLEATVIDSLNEYGINEIDLKVLEFLADQKNISVDYDNFIQELKIYNKFYSKQKLKSLGQKAHIIFNPEDKVIRPQFIKQISSKKNNHHQISSLENDPTCHIVGGVELEKVLDKI